MSSTKRILSSRANGALSRGPKTQNGKNQSSRNAVRHGLLSNLVVLKEEPSQAFDELVTDFNARFEPVDGVEAGMVDEMVATSWRIRRAWAIENRLLDTAMALQPGATPVDRLTTAFSALAGDNQFNLLHRYETRLHTMFQRALYNLVLLRQLSIPREAWPPSPAASGTPGIPNEPRKSRVFNIASPLGELEPRISKLIEENEENES